MKRILALILSCLLCLPCAGAEEESVLYSHACHIAQTLDEIASCEAYMQLFTTDREMLDLVAGWAAGAHDAPVAAYRLTVDPRVIDMFAGYEFEEAAFPADVAAQLYRHIAVALPTQLNAALGAKTLAASSMATYGTAFAGTGDYCVYFLSYDEGSDVAVSFWPAEEGVVSANAVFLAEDFPAEQMDALGIALQRIQ